MIQLKYSLYIFDIDGTLTSTNQLIYDSFNHINEKYLGKTLSAEEIISLFGPTEEEIIVELFGDNADSAISDYFIYYKDNHDIASLHEGIDELLDYIIKNGGRVAAFTGKGRRSAEITLRELGIFEKVEFLVSGDDVAKKKPSGEGIFKILDHFKIPPIKTLMIGDSISDIKAAREAGVDIASVIWDCYSVDIVTQMNGKNLFTTAKELQSFIEK
ncbi:MAG: HAD-IA family hydrolase [Ignavibacteriales bacterium]|nr:HAD-IA family hydrolase [Ignavibacteriales bacterium]